MEETPSYILFNVFLLFHNDVFICRFILLLRDIAFPYISTSGAVEKRIIQTLGIIYFH
jgi:hypothetical protein